MVYIIGKVTFINSNYIYLESNYVGRKIFIKQNENVVLNKIMKFFTTEIMVETSKGQCFKQLYGFLSFSDFALFNKLITLPTIGPKTAMIVLENDQDLLNDCINNKDWVSLSNIKGISEKTAQIIVNNLADLNTNNKKEDRNLSNKSTPSLKNKDNDEDKYLAVIESLRSLGYSKKEIEYGISKLEFDPTQEFIVEDVLAQIIKHIANHKVS